MGPGPDVAGGCIGGAARVVVVTLLHMRVDVRLLAVQGGQGCPTGYPYGSVKIFPRSKLHIRMQIKIMQNLAIH